MLRKCNIAYPWNKSACYSVKWSAIIFILKASRPNKQRRRKNKMSPKRQTTAFIFKQILHSSNSVISREDVFCKRALRDSHRGNTHYFVSQKITFLVGHSKMFPRLNRYRSNSFIFNTLWTVHCWFGIKNMYIILYLQFNYYWQFFKILN